MRNIILFTTIAFAFIACEDEPVPNDNMPSDEQIRIVASQTNKPESEIRAYYEKCVAEGGKGIIGGFGQPACEKPSADAGKSCTQNSDCESLCLAETKSCAPRSPMFGCFEVLPEPGNPATICVD